MTPTPQQIQELLDAGWAYFVVLSGQESDKAESGCGCCGNKVWPCLFRNLNALQWRSDLVLYDDATNKLYQNIKELIGYQ